MMGYFSIDRELADAFLPEPGATFTKSEAFTYLCSRVAFASSRRRVGEKFISLNPGEMIASERFLQKAWGWSRTKVRNFKSVLKEAGVLDQREDRGETVLILDFKRNEDRGDTTKETRRKTTERPVEDQRETKEEKDKKEEHERGEPRAAPLPADLEFCQEALRELFPTAVWPMPAEELELVKKWETAMVEMDAEDYEALVCWFVKADDMARAKNDAKRVRALWPRHRGEFLENFAEAVEKIRRWWLEFGEVWWTKKIEARRRKQERMLQAEEVSEERPMSREEIMAFFETEELGAAL